YATRMWAPLFCSLMRRFARSGMSKCRYRTLMAGGNYSLVGLTTIGPVVAPPRHLVVARGPVDRERRLDAVAQSQERVGHRAPPVELLDLVPQLAEDSPGAVEPPLRAQEPHVVPHGVADDHPVLRDQRGIHRLVLRLPLAHAGEGAGAHALGLPRRGLPPPPAPQEPLEQRGRRQPVGAVDAGARDLAGGAQVPERRPSVAIDRDAAAGVVRGGDDGDGPRGQVETELEAALHEPGEPLPDPAVVLVGD